MATDEAIENGARAEGGGRGFAPGLAAERRGDAEEAVALLGEALGGDAVPPAARSEAYAALVRAQAASGHGGLADQPAARTPGEADDPRSRMVTLHALAREAAGGDRQEALGFARGALALLDVTEEEREVASLRPR